MAREITPVFGWDTPVLGEEANVPADLRSLALDVENTVKELEPKRLKTAGAGDAAKILIVDGTGAAAFKAMSGDAIIGTLGVITIANEAVNAAKVLALAITEAKLAGEAVGSAKIAALAVTAAKLAAEAVETVKIKGLAVTEAKLAELAVSTAKIANAAVTSAKWKPSMGRIGVASEAEINSAVDLEIAKLEITPTVASQLLMIADLGLNVTEEGEFRITWKVNAAKHAYQKEKLTAGPHFLHRTQISSELPANELATIFLCVSRIGAVGKAKILNLEEWQSAWTYMMAAK